MINLAEIPKKSIISAFLLLPIFLNMVLWKNMYLGLFFMFFFFLYFGYNLGNAFRLQSYGMFWNTFFGSLLLTSILLILGSFAYYFSSFNTIAISIVILVAALGAIIFPKKNNNGHITPNNGEKMRFSVFFIIFIFLFLEILNFYIILQSGTHDAIRSPWQVVPKNFFLVYFFSTFFLIVISIYNKKNYITLACIIVHFLLSTSIAIFIYNLGYGFDPIIHQATEKVIANTGTITPKPLYYIGQYVLVVLLSKTTLIPISLIDLYLVPVLFSLCVPMVIYFTFSQVTQKTNYLPFASVSFLMFPFSSFIVTTPQALANIFILVIIFLSPIIIFTGNKKWISPLCIFSLATLFIHPLTGIPASVLMAFILILFYLQPHSSIFSIIQKSLLTELSIFSSIIFPLVFVMNSEFSKTLSSIMSLKLFSNFKNVQDTFLFFMPSIKNNFNIIYDIIYWYDANIYALLILITLCGSLLLYRRYSLKKTMLYPLLFFIFFINYVLVSLIIQFPSLIDYERSNYQARIFEISFYFLFPIIFFAFLYALAQNFKKTKTLMPATILFMSIAITSSLYLSYPRVDDYHLDRGYNITQTDINTVRYIDDTAKGDYIVLANQMTSVAAIREFGFKKYFHDLKNKKDYFYYPIPTGDPLYQYYLDMVYKNPNKKTAEAAGAFMGVQHVYFVLSSYWDKFEELTEKAKQGADTWQSIDQDKAFVFYYDLSRAQ